MNAIPLDQAERMAAGQRQRPTVEGARQAWGIHNGPVHAPSLAYRPLPEREWAVEGLVPLRAVTLLSGDGGSGKSTLALQLACATVLGRAWLGRDAQQGHAAYVSCEDDIDELHRRLAAIASAEDWDLADLAGFQLFDRVGLDSAVMYRGKGFGEVEDSPWWISFSNWVRENSPRLIVLDSLYDFFGTFSQLDSGTARLFMGRLRELAHDAGCAIIVLWHPSKSGMESGDGTSGNVAFRNACRAMLYLEKDKEAGDDAPLILRGKKSNYGPAAAEVRVQWEAGRFVPVLTDEAPTGALAGIAKRSADSAFLDALDAAAEQGRHVSHSRGANYAPKIFAGMTQAAGFKLRDMERAMERLFAAGEIEVGQIGTYPNRHPKMGLKRKTGGLGNG